MGKRRGIFLITTLFVVMFLTIMGTAVMSEILQGMTSSGSFSDRELALQAAMSGLTYVQARLESNCATLAPNPDGGPLADDFATTAFEVQEKGYNLVGVLTDQNVETTGHMRILFRASFNKQYGVLSTDSVWPSLGAGLPAMPYVSLNCLRVAPGPSFNSYQNGVPLHAVPAEMADVIVEGLVVREDGSIRARRTAEAMFNLTNIPSVNAAPVSSAGNIDLQMLSAGDQISVTSLAGGGSLDGLTSLNNINIVSPDPVGGPTPPDYTSNGKATVPSGKQFNFGAGNLNASTGVVTYTGAPTNYGGNSAVTNLQTVNPPAVTNGQLPALSATAVSVPAGTWVAYNNQLYHFPVAFQATNPDGTPMTAEQQPLTVVAGVPNYNGIAPSPNNGQMSLDGTAATAFNPGTNTITVTQDVSVQPTAGISSLGIVVAPSSLQASGNSNAILLNMQPATAGSTVQLRAADAVSVVGNVVGTGDVVIGAVGGTPATVPADVTITGKSQTSTASDTAVALYATGNVNLAAIDPQQPPVGVSPVTTGSDAMQAVVNALANTGGLYQSGVMYTTTGGQVGFLYTAGTGPGSTANLIANTNIQFTDPAGQQYTGYVLDVLWQVSQGGPGMGGPTPPGEINVLNSTLNTYMTQNWQADPSPPPLQGYTSALQIPSPTWLQNINAGTGFVGATGPGPQPLPPGYDQSFNGLVYAYNNFNVFNGNNIALNGALVTYGGNPNSGAPGSLAGTGNVNVVGQNMTFVFDPNKVGIFANFFGGEVTLGHTAISVF